MAALKDNLSVKEVAVYLRVNPMTVYRLKNRGELPYFNVGRSIRFRREDVEALRHRHREKKEAEEG